MLKKVIIFLIVLALLILGGMKFFEADYARFCDETVPIFAYHRVEYKDDVYTMPPEQFDQQMQYLKEQGYQTIKLEDYVQGRREGKVFHKTCVVIFDDGYLENLTYAAPIMQKYGFVGNMFMAVKFEGWPGYLDWHTQHDLLRYGWAEGSHTFDHEPLTKMSPEEVDYELERSMKYVRGIYNPAIGIAFSYPNGACNDRIAAQVEKAGYIAGVAGTVGVNTNKVPLMQLRRVNVFQNKPEDIGCFIYELHKAQLISYIAQTGIDPGWLLAWYHRIRG